MKREYFATLGFVGLIMCLVLLFSCEKDPWKWNTDRKNAIYFWSDTMKVIFTEYNDSTWAETSVFFRLVGMPVDYDREIPFEIVEEQTNLPFEEFKLDGTILPAGGTGEFLHVWVKRPRYKNQENGELYLTVRVGENENFGAMMKSKVFVPIYVEHPEGKPSWWDETIFGKYSETAYKIYFKFYDKVKVEQPVEWTSIFVKVYGEKMKSMSGKTWTGQYLTFLPKIKSYVLEPMFDYYTRNPDPSIEIPGWYKELEK